MSTPNVALLRQTLAHIEAHPETWYQATWRNPNAECGTSYCFAGWAATLSGAQWDKNSNDVAVSSLPQAVREEWSDYNEDVGDGWIHISDAAAQLLGLLQRHQEDGYTSYSAPAADDLFDPDNDLDDLRRIVAELCGVSAEAVTS